MSNGQRADGSEEADPGREQSERLKQSRDALLEGIAETLANLHRLRSVADAGRPAGPELPRVDVGAATDGDVLLDFVQMQLEVMNRVLAFGRDHADYFMNRLKRAREPRPGAPLRALRISGVPGGEAAGKFVVENASRSEVTISVRAGGLAADQCDASFEGAVRVTPEEVRLGPGQEAEVEVKVTLEAARFAPRQRYRGTLEVTSPQHPRRVMPLWVEVQEAPAPSAP